ncbi:hypothetical protein EGR_11017 [Echinococcus granulosus]|uniref:Uncharacterized protein n=1 Tax=Echinococcus granulosus TaxID=6210 RepID=W6TZH9_ECHGR|nr:hypothetical protein EGR_11017 [Echinococcus granulosus]EUB54123.1 hypothetical protein EGR_11017 [Echinococcus granulosus]
MVHGGGFLRCIQAILGFTTLFTKGLKIADAEEMPVKGQR